MKTNKKSAVTLIELLVVIAIIAIFSGMVFSSLKLKPAREKQNQTQLEHKVYKSSFNVGDTVYIDGMDITGKVNMIWGDDGSSNIDILVKDTNGLPKMIEKINSAILKKVPSTDDWKK